MSNVRPVVCALDFSEGSEAALVRAADLAERLRTRLHLLHASPLFRTELGSLPQPDEPDAILKGRVREFAERVFGGADALDVLGPEVAARRGEYAADAILRYAEEVGAGLLVLGTHGRRGVRHLIVGSVAEEVLRQAACPVLTVPNAARRTAPSPTAPVLAPVDFSDPSREALGVAKEIAALFEAPVEVVHVLASTEPYPSFYFETGMIQGEHLTALAQTTEEYLRAFDTEAGGGPAAAFHVLSGAAHREIARLAEGGYGLVVMATHGLTGLKHALLGSVTERTLRLASCPVLSIRVEGAGGEVVSQRAT